MSCIMCLCISHAKVCPVICNNARHRGAYCCCIVTWWFNYHSFPGTRAILFVYRLLTAPPYVVVDNNCSSTFHKEK